MRSKTSCSGEPLLKYQSRLYNQPEEKNQILICRSGLTQIKTILTSWKSYKVHDYQKINLDFFYQNSGRKMNVEDPDTFVGNWWKAGICYMLQKFT